MAVPQPPDDDGRIAQNVMHFARLLRAAGLRVGTGHTLDAIAALETVGLARRDDVYWTLHAIFISRHEQTVLFDQAFHMFWRNLDLLRRMMNMALPDEQAGPGMERQETAMRRLAEALMRQQPPRELETRQELESDQRFTFSADEILQTKDFEQMSQAELALARAALSRMRMDATEVPTRRYRVSSSGQRSDARASMRASLKAGGAVIALRHKIRRTRLPALVVLCDISGSMSQYSRLFLQFLHAVTNDRDRVYSFVFGTRLTNITRHLRDKDVDRALSRIGADVADWAGGTRIGACLGDFNRNWSRRVLGQGATVILVTDGLDRAAGEGLAPEIERLHKSCRRLIWLNPLLRYDGFEPKSLGIRAILPHVDEFRPVHNLNSLTDLADALGKPATRTGPTPWQKWESAA